MSRLLDDATSRLVPLEIGTSHIVWYCSQYGTNHKCHVHVLVTGDAITKQQQHYIIYITHTCHVSLHVHARIPEGKLYCGQGF